MSFDIHELDEIEYDGSSEAEDALQEYQDSLIEAFIQSPEGKKHEKEYSEETGFWIAQFIYYGIDYTGSSIPQMEKSDAIEIVTGLFPRKISLSSPDDADDAIPELIAFWKYLNREFKLPNAEKIISFLQKVEPDFINIINDSSRFGMAKSFLQRGQSAGFDITNPEGLAKLTNSYHESLTINGPEETASSLADPSVNKNNKNKKEKKKSQKMKKASQRKNRKK